MNMGLKIVIASLAVAMLIPVVHYQALYNVDVTWSIGESIPREHAVTFKDQTFVIPAGGSVTKSHRLRGGGTASLTYAMTGWGVRANQLFVDGREIPLNQITSSRERGRLRILGMGLKPSMKAQISIN